LLLLLLDVPIRSLSRIDLRLRGRLQHICDILYLYFLISFFIVARILFFEIANQKFSVTKYSLGSAILTLEHNHPQGNRLKVLVDVNLLLNGMKSNETRIGEWVNVIGYIQSQQKPDTSEKIPSNIPVQAIVLWSSGPFNLEGYERSLDQKNAEEITNTLG
jgi:hypothetical protein